MQTVCAVVWTARLILVGAFFKVFATRLVGMAASSHQRVSGCLGWLAFHVGESGYVKLGNRVDLDGLALEA
jgi:hypothetical protein